MFIITALSYSFSYNQKLFKDKIICIENIIIFILKLFWLRKIYLYFNIYILYIYIENTFIIIKIVFFNNEI